MAKSKKEKQQPKGLSIHQVLEQVINGLPQSNAKRLAAEKAQEFIWWMEKALKEGKDETGTRA